jgi:hypothetical protein
MSDFNKKFNFFDRFSKNTLNTKFNENPSSGSRVPCERKHGLDTKLTAAPKQPSEPANPRKPANRRQ